MRFEGHLHPERTEHSILYKNMGGLKFKDVTKEMNLVYDGWSGDASFCDVNGRGWPGNLYVLNMMGDNHFREPAGQGFHGQDDQLFRENALGRDGDQIFRLQQRRPDGFAAYPPDMHSDMEAPAGLALAQNFDLNIEKAKSDEWCGAGWKDWLLKGRTNLDLPCSETPSTAMKATACSGKFPTNWASKPTGRGA